MSTDTMPQRRESDVDLGVGATPPLPPTCGPTHDRLPAFSPRSTTWTTTDRGRPAWGRREASS